jgi:adenylosuccinate lyase
MANHDTYEHPLAGRYASKEMKHLFSDDVKFTTWRRLWIEIARAEMELDINIITLSQIKDMEDNISHIDYEMAAREEKKRRHDVMAHVYTFGEAAKSAAGIIHLGCTSCDITDNAELITMRSGLNIIAEKIARVINNLMAFAYRQKNNSLPCLGYTHYQPAQPTTPGKRACIWINDLLIDLKNIERCLTEMRFRGIQGTVGTQASFLELFHGDHEKVKKLNKKIAEVFGFSSTFMITGQTYTRKQDSEIMHVFSSLGATAYKMCGDIRLLAHDKEIEEPYEEDQIGSSAMPFKRNPMKSERTDSLCRCLMGISHIAYQTHANQWLERSLDDSAARRIYISEAFLLADAVLQILQNVSGALIIYPKVIESRLKAELPFMATEYIIAAMVEKGSNRQEVHEKMRIFSQIAGDRVKLDGLDNNLLDLIRADDFFSPIHDRLENIFDPKRFIGRAMEQIDDFYDYEVTPALEKYKDRLEEKIELNV